jgi:c-di-GMP-binding flagellar brake protein YcgR
MSYIDNNILVSLIPEQVVKFGEPDNTAVRNPKPEFYGKFLYNDKKEQIILGICVDKAELLTYRADDEIDISYERMNIKYKFKALVIRARRALSNDGFETHDMLQELKGASVDKYILEVVPLGKSEAKSQREFFRLPLQMEIYYKIIMPDNLSEIKEADLKFEITQAQMFKKEADNGILEEEAGYLKLITADISGGGFMYKSPDRVEAETYLDCMVMVDREALPVVAKILRSRRDDILGGYIVQVQFHKISDPVRDRLVRYLISQQRHQQMKFSRK